MPKVMVYVTCTPPQSTVPVTLRSHNVFAPGVQPGDEVTVCFDPMDDRKYAVELPGGEDADPATGLVPLGDMVISMERVQAQAKEYGHSNRRELAYLVVHSVLHLLGYDHLDEGPQKARMRAREDAIMAELGIER